MYSAMPFFPIIMNNKFCGIFGNLLFFSAKINVKNLLKNIPIYWFAEPFLDVHPFPLHNEPTSMSESWKLWEELALKWPEMSIFRRAVYTNMYYQTINDSISTQDIVWLLLGYPSKYCNHTYKRKLGPSPPSPQPPLVGNFFNIYLIKTIIEYKSVNGFEFDLCATHPNDWHCCEY